PGAVVTAIAWLAIFSASVLWAPALPWLPAAWRISGGLAATILAPALVFAQFTIHNAAAVLFPAWVPLGSSRPRGLDAMGPRLIMFAGILLGLLVILAPGAIAGGIIWLALHRFVGALALPPAASACTAVVLIEVLIATEMLGPVYERLDLSGIERPE